MNAAVEQLLANDLLRIVDVGASGGIDPRWSRLTSRFHAFMFEPDPREYARLAAAPQPNLTLINCAASHRSGPAQFHLCRKQQVSSMLKPNAGLLNRFPDAGRFEVVDTVHVETDSIDRRLDTDIDFLKIDTQGHDLAVLEGATRALDGCIGVEIEVEFVPMYEGQPLFRDVDAFLAGRGFELMDLRRYYWQRRLPRYDAAKGQLVFGDALYFRTPERLVQSDVTAAKCIRAICVYLAYGYADLALTLLALAGTRIRPEQAALVRKAAAASARVTLPDFRGKQTLALWARRLMSLFASRDPWAGTDSKVGN